MYVRDAMSRDLAVLTPQASLLEAARQLLSSEAGALPVVDCDGRLLATLTEADVIRESLVPRTGRTRLVAPTSQGPGARRVGDLSLALHAAVSPDDELAEAARLLLDHHAEALPVLSRGLVVGMISRRDLVRHLAGRDERVRLQVADLMREGGLDWMVEVRDGVVTLTGPTTEADRQLAERLHGAVRGVTGVSIAPAPVAADASSQQAAS